MYFFQDCDHIILEDKLRRMTIEAGIAQRNEQRYVM
jgi:hypothetical protein